MGSLTSTLTSTLASTFYAYGAAALGAKKAEAKVLSQLKLPQLLPKPREYKVRTLLRCARARVCARA
jgi:hypothetical protein